MSLGRLYKLTLPTAPNSADSTSTEGGAGGDRTELLFGGERIPRETLRALSMAESVVHQAATDVARMQERGRALIEAQARQGYAQGFAQGKVRGMTAVLGTMEVERRLRDLLSHRLADIVEHCLRNLLGELGEAELLRQRIKHLLASAGQPLGNPAADTPSAASPAATLYVGPEQFALAQKVVSELGQGTPGNLAGLVVVLDERRPVDALLLETKVCFIDSNLTLTLEDLRLLVQHALEQALKTLGESA